MTKSPQHYSPLDIHDVLRERRQVAVIWSVEDVQCVRADLTDEQAWEVLLQCVRCHDGEVGFTWHLIEAHADDLFPRPLDRERAERS